MNAAAMVRRHRRPARGRQLLCRWLLVGRLAFAQLGARTADEAGPAIAWVQMLSETPADWHPLETVDERRVLTVEHRIDGQRLDEPGRCPN